MTRLQSLEQRISTLVLVAGGLMVVHTGVHVLIAYTNTNYPLHHEMPFGFLGHLVALVALLGLYPRLVTRSPKLTRVGAGVVVLAMVGLSAVGTMTLAESLGVTPPAFLRPVGLLFILGVILGYLAFGVAGLRTDVVTRTTALAILTPVIVMIYNMAVALTTGGTREGQIIVAGGFALTHLAIGAALRSEEFPTGDAEPAASPAA
ncbi:MAG: hypothetical protein ABEH81_05890 [Halopenitus sp.]